MRRIVRYRALTDTAHRVPEAAALTRLFMRFGAASGRYADASAHVGDGDDDERDDADGDKASKSGSGARTAPVFRVLALLEDATQVRAMCVCARGECMRSQALTQRDANRCRADTDHARSAIASRWALVTAFCHAHRLPLSTGHLCELAAKGDWYAIALCVCSVLTRCVQAGTARRRTAPAIPAVASAAHCTQTRGCCTTATTLAGVCRACVSLLLLMNVLCVLVGPVEYASCSRRYCSPRGVATTARRH
jgi:hypothetical protein